MMARTSNVASVDFVRRAGDLDRLENCTPVKVDQIVGIVRAILNDEMNRKPRKGCGNYIGVNIYRDGTRVHYAENYGKFGKDSEKLFIAFENEEDAKWAHYILCGLLMLGLSRWTTTRARYDDTMELAPVPEVEEYSAPRSATHHHIVPDVSAFDFFEKQ